MRGAVVAGGRHRVERRGDRLGAQEHPGATAIRVVIDAPMPTQTPGPQVVGVRAWRHRCASARPGMLSLSGPGNTPGKSVMTSMRSVRSPAARRTHPSPRRSAPPARRPCAHGSCDGRGPASAAPCRPDRARRHRRRAGPLRARAPGRPCETAGTSSSPRGPSTTKTSPPPARKMSPTRAQLAARRGRRPSRPMTSCQ